MKKIICFILIFLMLFSYISINAFAENKTSPLLPTILLRAGGGSGGGSGGGGSGGSSSDGTSHAGTSRPPTLIETILQIILLPFLFFSSSILFFVKLTKRSRKSKKLMKQLMQSDNAWKFKDISATVKESFYSIQTAWTNMDMTTASQYMSEDLYNSFQTKLSWMEYRNKKNILENINLIQALPVAVHDDPDNSRDFIWFYIKGRMIDYTIDTTTQLKIDGKVSPATFVEYWRFVRKDDTWVLNKILQKDEEDQIPFIE